MKKCVLFVVVILVVVGSFGCSSEPEPSDLFKSQALRFVEEASKLKSMTEHGVSFVEYSSQLSEVEGAYELLDSLWTEGFEVETQENIEKALEGWEWAEFLWDQKIEHYLSRITTDVDTREYFDRIYDYAGDSLEINTGIVMIENEVTGEEERIRSLPYDENIVILFSLASDYFDEAQSILLQIIQ